MFTSPDRITHSMLLGRRASLGPGKCLGCAYPKEGLPADVPCPECGFPRSLRCDPSRLLRHADPQYLRSITHGLFLILASQVGLILTPVVFFGSFALPSNHETFAGVILFSWLAICIVVHCESVRRLTRRAAITAFDRFDEFESSRRLCRLSGFAVGLLQATLLALIMLKAADVAIQLLLSAIGLSALVFLFALEGLARRIEWQTASWKFESARDYALTRSFLVGFALLEFASIAFSLLANVIVAGPKPIPFTSEKAAGLATCALPLAALAYILGIGTVYGLWKAARHELRESATQRLHLRK